MIEMRWKTKERKVMKALQPNTYGSPAQELTEQYKVLEYRERVSVNVVTNWIEIPTVGLNAN